MSKNIVFIVNIPDTSNQSKSSLYQYSIKSWSKWCQKNNCELFVLEERMYPADIMNAEWHKILVFDLLESNDIDYNQILVVDADTIIHPNAPNIFDFAENKYCAIRNYGSMDWVCRSYENYKKHLFPEVTYSPIDYFNSGVIMLNKSHKEFYSKVHRYYLDNRDNIQLMQKTYDVGNIQPILNFLVRLYNIDLKLLPYEWNMQDMGRFEILNQSLTFINIGWIYHFCAIPGGDETAKYWMQLTYNTLYNEN